MGTSGNPAKKAATKKASPKTASVSAFKKRAAGIDLQLPSELWVKAKRVELQTFILKGDVPNPLMEVVSEALEKGQKADIPSMVGVDEGKVDLAMVQDMYDMVNRVVIASILSPKVHPVPTAEDLEEYNRKHPDEPLDDPEELRSDDLLYIDEVDDEDKMFVFQWASGGTSDIEQFRSEARADLDALAKIEGSRAATQ